MPQPASGFYWIVWLLLACSGGLATSAWTAPPTVQFVSPEKSPFLADEGKVPLQWKVVPSSGADAENMSYLFEIEQSQKADFSEAWTRYQGLDLATYVSGLPSGDFYYRVRAQAAASQDAPAEEDAFGPWSKTMVVQVRYQSWKWVVGLMGLGVIVLIATVAVIVSGQIKMARKEAIEP